MIYNDDEKPVKLVADDYNRKNGIIICCCTCGREFEETDGGYYMPLEYEHERYERKCGQCRKYYAS